METPNDALVKRYNQLYLAVILRYKDYIEHSENLNVAELPKLITPKDEDVVAIANKFKSTFTAYSYGRDFATAAKIVLDYVANQIFHATLPIEFWLYPKDTIKCEAGDLFDKATLLCSLLIALGNASSRVVIVTKPNERRFIVYCEVDDKIMALDLDRGIISFDSREKLLESLVLKDDAEITAYEFNDKMYNNLA